MPAKTYDTEDWKLECFIDWRPKYHQEKCHNCNGLRMVGGGFGSIDGATECTTCHGTGSINKGPSTPRPELPLDLREHLRRAWYDFFNTPKQ